MTKGERQDQKHTFFTFRHMAIIITFLVVSLSVFFGVQLATGTGLFHHPGELIFTDDTTEVVRDFISTTLLDRELKNNLTISSTTSTTYTPSDHSVLYNITLPVTDFYSSVTSVSAEEASHQTLVSVWNLDPSQKLLAIDGNYYLDTLTSGAFFETINFSSENSTELQDIVSLVRSSIDAFPTQDTVLSFAQTGVTALSRNMNAKLAQGVSAASFAEYIGPYLSKFDLTHTSNESSFADHAPTTSGGTVICSEPAMVDVLTTIGLDIVELTGNHNQDCGDQAALETIDKYHELAIKVYGGGKTATEAALPLEIEQKSTHLTLLGYNLSTGGYTLDDTPGANFYTEDKARSDIATAKARGDAVIVDVQYYECNAYASTTEDETCDYANSSAGDQVGLFRSLIDMGADIVVGTSAHQPQTYERYGNGSIYYGLGNLFFDQSWWPGTSRSLILEHYFLGGKYVQTRLVPTIYDSTYQTKLMETADAEAFLARLATKHP